MDRSPNSLLSSFSDDSFVLRLEADPTFRNSAFVAPAKTAQTQSQEGRGRPAVPGRVSSVSFSPNTKMKQKVDATSSSPSSLHQTVQEILEMTDDRMTEGHEVVDTRIAYPDHSVQSAMLGVAYTRSTLTQDSQTAALAGIPGLKKKRPSIIKQGKNFLKRRGSKAKLGSAASASSQAGDPVDSANTNSEPAARERMASPISNLTDPTGIKSDDEWDSESSRSYASYDESHDYSHSTGMSSRRTVEDHGLFGNFMASSERAFGSIAQSLDQLFEGSFDESDDETRTFGSDSEFASVRHTRSRSERSKRWRSPDRKMEKISESPTDMSQQNQNLSDLKNNLKLQRSSSVPRTLVPGRRDVSSLGDPTIYPIERNRSEEELAAETMVMAVESWFGARYGRQCTPTRERLNGESPTIDTTIRKPVEPIDASLSPDATTRPVTQVETKEKAEGASRQAIPLTRESPMANPPTPPPEPEERKKLPGQEKVHAQNESTAPEKTSLTPDKEESSRGKASRQDAGNKTKQGDGIKFEKTLKSATVDQPDTPGTASPQKRAGSNMRSPFKRGRRLGRSLGEVWRSHRAPSKDRKQTREESPAGNKGALTSEQAPDRKKIDEESPAKQKGASAHNRPPSRYRKRAHEESPATKGVSASERAPSRGKKRVPEESPTKKGASVPERAPSRGKKTVRAESPARRKRASTPEGEKTTIALESGNKILAVSIFPETASASQTPNQRTPKSAKSETKSPIKDESNEPGSPDAIAAALKRKSRYRTKHSGQSTPKQNSPQKIVPQDTVSSSIQVPKGLKATTSSAGLSGGKASVPSVSPKKSTTKEPPSKKQPNKESSDSSSAKAAKAKVPKPEEAKKPSLQALPPKLPQTASSGEEAQPKRVPGLSVHPKASQSRPESPVDPTQKSKKQGLLKAIRRRGMNLLNSDSSNIPAERSEDGFKTTIILTSNRSSLNPTSAAENPEPATDDDDSTILERSESPNTEEEYVTVRPISPLFGFGTSSFFCIDLTDHCSSRCTYRIEDPDSPETGGQRRQSGFPELQNESQGDPFASGIQGHVEAFVAGLTGRAPAERSLMEVPSVDETGARDTLRRNSESPSKEGGLCNSLGLAQVENTSQKLSTKQDIQSFLGTYKDDLELKVRNTFSLDYFDDAMAQASKDWSNLAVMVTQNEQRLTESNPTSSTEETENEKNELANQVIPMENAEVRPTTFEQKPKAAIEYSEPSVPSEMNRQIPESFQKKLKRRPSSPSVDKPKVLRKGTSSKKVQKDLSRKKSSSPGPEKPRSPRRTSFSRVGSPTPQVSIPLPFYPVNNTASKDELAFFEEEKSESSGWVSFESKVFVASQRRTVQDLSPKRIYKEEEKVSTPEPRRRRRTPLDGFVFPVETFPSDGKVSASPKVVGNLRSFAC